MSSPTQLGFFGTERRLPARGRASGKIPSLIKWTGSKRSQAHRIGRLIPEHRRYCEPFLGGGALLFIAARRGSLAGDVYAPLVEFWKLVQERPQHVINEYEREWLLLQDDFPSHYYFIRDRFNESPNGLDLAFLTRTCVNGIVRFNSSGEFNNSLHLSRRGMQPARFASVVRKWNAAIQGVRFVCQDYRQTLTEVEAGDFVYLDPPYAGTSNRYAQTTDLENLFAALDELNARGVKWALSFDGRRGDDDLTAPVPERLFTQHLFLPSGRSPVGKVLNSAGDHVHESLYLNYTIE